MSNTEIEARFLNVNAEELKAKLLSLGASDTGEDFLQETIFYDKELTWQKTKTTIVRIRKNSKATRLTYKHVHDEHAADGTTEIDLHIQDADKGRQFMEALGLVAYRVQEKRRHSFQLGDVSVDIDFWPSVPPYVELEGPSEQAIQAVAAQLGFEWKDAVFGNAGRTLETYYNIPLATLRFFTFKKIA